MRTDEKLDILLDNLKICLSRKNADDEQRRICLSQISKLLCKETEGLDLPDAVRQFRDITEDDALSDDFIFCSTLVSIPALRESIIYNVCVGHDEATQDQTRARIAYTKNNYSDEAFEIFSSKLKNAEAHYIASMADACESVTDGSCEFCILPVRNSLDGRLWGFYSMLDRYGLKICAVCNIDATDGTSSTDYALIGKFCPEPTKQECRSLDELIFEFSILSENGDFLADLLSAAKACSATVLFVDTRPIEYDVQLCRYVFSLRVSAENSLILRMLIATRYDSYSPIGLYNKN